METFAGWINDQGEIVGNYDDGSGTTHGSLRTESNFSAIDFPVRFRSTARFGIRLRTGKSDLYDDSNGITHGFSLLASKLSTVDFRQLIRYAGHSGE